MADDLGMDPDRIERLRDPARLEQADPLAILDVTAPHGDGDLIDVGTGVGYVSLPLARRFPHRQVVACDVLNGMLSLLADATAQAGVGNLKTALMPDAVTLPLARNSASFLMMMQVHHELDDAVALLEDCRRVLQPGAPIVIVDWKDGDLPGMPKGGRRIAEAAIASDLASGGFEKTGHHAVYPLHSVTIGFAP